MNVTSSNRLSRGRKMVEYQSQRGFGVQPTSFRTATSVSPQKTATGSSAHHKRLRRLSMDQHLPMMTNYKTKAIVIINDNIESTNENVLQPIKQPFRYDAVNSTLDVSVKADKPVRKLNRNVSSITVGSVSASSVAIIDHDDSSDDDSVALNKSWTSNYGTTGDNNDRKASRAASETVFQGRKVRFPIDENGKIQCQEHHLSDDDTAMFRQCQKKELWWSKKDRLATRDAAKLRIELIPKLFPAYESATIQVLTKFGGLDETKETLIASRQILSSSYDQQRTSDSYAMQTIARSSELSRGLEKWLYKVVGLPLPKHRNSVKQIIATQQALKSSGCLGPDLIASVLAAQYIQGTAAAIVMAQLQADIDVLALEGTERKMFII